MFIRTRGRLRLEWKLAIFLLLGSLLLWSMVAVELHHLRTTAERETGKELRNLAHAYSEEVNSSVSTIDLSLVDLRVHWTHDRNNFRKIVADLQQHLENKIIFQIGVTDAQGRVVFSSVDPAARPRDLSDREHIRVHRERTDDRLFISKPVLGQVSGQWSIQFTRPVYTPDGQYDGVIVASVSPSYFSRFHQEINLGAGSALMLVRTEGTIIARTPHQREGAGMGVVLTGLPFDTAAPSAVRSHRAFSRVDGVERFYAWRALPRYGLVVAVGQSVDDTFAHYRRQRWAYLLGAAGISVLLAIAGYALLSAARRNAIANEALAESEARWKFALEGAGDGVWDWDLERGMVQLSKRSREILGISDDAANDSVEAIYKLAHPQDAIAVFAAVQAHLAGETPTYVMEHRIRDRNGVPVWVLARGMVVRRSKEGRPQRMVGTFADISERKAREELISHLAHHDSLTNLPNRALFKDRLQQALLKAKRENSQLGLIYFDLDEFKPVNDTHGHAVGDLLLKAVADRVRGRLRKSDTVARVGGDEFVVLLPTIGAESDAVAVAKNILDDLNTPYDIEGLSLHISGSIGIVTYPKDGQDEATLMRCADRAMYQAKASGRNRVQEYTPSTEV